MSHAEIRALCHADAMKWVDIQRSQFQRLGSWETGSDPYLTLNPRYEAGILDVLADLVEGGYVYRQLKPIHWCMTDRTALAEAELEYQEETTPSIYVNFPMISGVPADWDHEPWHAMIWTTTPWTLPANVAIAVHPDLDYAAVRYVESGDRAGGQTILAAELVAQGDGLRQIDGLPRGGAVQGAGAGARPLPACVPGSDRADRAGRLCERGGRHGAGSHAPGHGTEDYQTGQKYGLPTLSPVDAVGPVHGRGARVGRGQRSSRRIRRSWLSCASMGGCYHELPLEHSYPHCWRCKKPVIFRATEQWFVRVDHEGLRERTLEVD